MTAATLVSRFPVPPLRWVVAPQADPALARELAAALSLPLPLAELLVQRGFADPSVARTYLRPSLDTLSDPLALAGMAAAVEAVVRTVQRGGTILVHGDYDVDGQCATALLTRVLRAANARVVPFVPHRMTDGYDFGPAGLRAAADAGAELIITCDCGITAVETVRAARDAGRDVIVTDHHIPGPELPDATAVVDPQRPDDTSDARILCGTGVAFKLVQGLVPALGLPAALPFHFLDLVALATVADLVPLTGENRVLVRHGLKLLPESRWPGLRALIRTGGLEGKEIRTSHLGYVLGPRLNAVGRLGAAFDGVRLLLTDDEQEAATLAQALERINVQRQGLDQRILDQAIAQVERDADPVRDAAFVLAGDDWHPGVVGIVASRVVERYGRPTFLVALEGETGRGSGRSVSKFDLHVALTACGDLLERYGGHRMAAGLTIRRDRVSAFRERFNALAREQLVPEDLGPEQRVDLILDLADATADLERTIRHLEPCGLGNAGPVFGVRGVRAVDARKVGGNHVKLVLTDGNDRLEAIGFGWADRAPRLDAPIDVAFRLEENAFQGRTALQARVVAMSAGERV
ncbi:MAG: single-stranded-DNA-specific exonuclease RecJ [Gemmatimonadales bacterium]